MLTAEPDSVKAVRAEPVAVGGSTLAQLIDPCTREGAPWEPLAGGRLRCVACGHRCVILPGQRGVCKVRYNQEGRLRAPWGYVAGLRLDPIEKKPFFHAFPGGAKALSFGMLGCDLHCAYCFTGGTPIVTRTGVVPIAVIFDEATGGIAEEDPQARHLRDFQIVTASGALRSVVPAFRHRYHRRASNRESSRHSGPSRPFPQGTGGQRQP
jgi:hypothetical protein